MALTGIELYKAAVEIVKAGMAGEAIKLHGCHSAQYTDSAKKHGEVDAIYLDTLIKGLIKTLGK